MPPPPQYHPNITTTQAPRHHHHPCTNPCTAQLVRQPQPLNFPPRHVPIGGTWYCWFIIDCLIVGNPTSTVATTAFWENSLRLQRDWIKNRLIITYIGWWVYQFSHLAWYLIICFSTILLIQTICCVLCPVNGCSACRLLVEIICFCFKTSFLYFSVTNERKRNYFKQFVSLYQEKSHFPQEWTSFWVSTSV